MATPAVIQAALATAQQSDLDWSDMALLLKVAITNAIVSSAGEIELPWSSQGADGVQIARISLADAMDMYQKFNSMASGGIVPQFAEFQDPANGWSL